MFKGRIILILLVLAAGVQFCAAEEVQWLQYYSAREASNVVGDMGSQSLEMSSEKPKGVELPDFKADKPNGQKRTSVYISG